MIRRITKFVKSPEGVSTVANVAGSALGLLSFFFITRSFSTNALGQWFMFLTGSTLTDMFRIGLVNNGFVYHASGKNDRERVAVFGSGIVLFTVLTCAISLLVFGATILFPSVTGMDSSWRLFFLWYPIFSLVSIPHNVSEWIAQSRRLFGRTLTIRIIIRGGLLLAAISNFFFFHQLTIDQLALCFVAVNAIASVLALIASWTPLSSIRSFSVATVKTLIQFGKFNSLTQVGANLLRSSDTFFLGSFLGPVAVARYSVPAKLLEIVELPLRSFGAAVFPEFSNAHQSNNIEKMKQLFIKNVTRLTLLVLPFVIIGILWADQVALVFGGSSYGDTGLILQCFLAYCLLIPFDRFSGIFIDSLNKPQYNSMKVWLMLGVNCVADIAALSLFGTPESIAAASLLTFSVGTVMNIFIIKRLLDWNMLSKEFLLKYFQRVAVVFKGTVS